jgi:hypothetical protein
MHTGIRKLDPKGTQFYNPGVHKSRAQSHHWYSGTQYLWALSVETVSCHPFGSRNLRRLLNFWNVCAPLHIHTVEMCLL